MTSLTRSIAGFVAGFSRQDIPAASLTLAREAFVDLVGVMLAGSNEPVVQRADECPRSAQREGCFAR